MSAMTGADGDARALPSRGRGSASIHAARDAQRARAEWKRRLRDREGSWAASRRLAAKLVEDPPEELKGMRLRELLLACRGVGPRGLDSYVQAAHSTMDATRCAHLVDKRLGELTEKQRWLLSGALRLDLSVGRQA